VLPPVSLSGSLLAGGRAAR